MRSGERVSRARLSIVSMKGEKPFTGLELRVRRFLSRHFHTFVLIPSFIFFFFFFLTNLSSISCHKINRVAWVVTSLNRRNRRWRISLTVCVHRPNLQLDNSGLELLASVNPIPHPWEYLGSLGPSLFLKQRTVRCVRISRSPPRIDGTEIQRSSSSNAFSRSKQEARQNRKQLEVSLHFERRTRRFYGSASFCWHHKRAGLSPEGSYGISRGSRRSSRARVEKLQKRALNALGTRIIRRSACCWHV